jgi:flagellin-like hook-associated protein FlgL
VFGISNLQTGNVTSNQTFTLNVEGTTVTANIVGSATLTVKDAIEQLNDQIGAHGVRATVVNGNLTFFSSKGYTVSTTGVAGGLITITDFKANLDINRVVEAVPGIGVAGAPGNNKVFTITFADQTQRTIDMGTAASSASAARTLLNAGLKDNGVTVELDSAGTGLIFMSAKADFSVIYDDGLSTTFGGYNAAQVSSNTSQAQAALAAVNEAVSKLGIVQGKIGTAQNKLSYAIQLAQSQITNFSAAESRIRDADVASEAANLTKAQVLSQASMAALAQANSAPQAVLSLLRG